uniref:Bestrophin homolog n=1 Tax=Strigamia maritima TaxID=126957 RepID=T1JAX6_STRMM
MTITYQFDVSTATFCGFAKLLGKWRGSIYKLVYKEMLVYCAGFTLISLWYRLLMTEEQKRTFEKVSLYCAYYLDLIPLSFVLGFYVMFVVQRWWNQFTTIPWPDRVMNTVAMYVHGSDDKGRLIRRTLMRYLNLSFVLILRSISIAVKKRFPTPEHLIEAGFLTQEEINIMDKINIKINKYWVPMNWFINLVNQARKEGRIDDGAPVKHILEELNNFRSKTSLLWCYDWVTVPIVYTQVVTWATHIFFIVCLIGRQYLDPVQKYDRHDIDMYVPFFTMLQFFFYMGWLKVAEQLINPFGEDEDDFETNWLVDRHIQVSYLGVDELYGKLPKMEKDIFWDDNHPNLPYTQATLIHKIPNYAGSTAHLRLSGNKEPMFHQRKDVPPIEDDKPKQGVFENIKNKVLCCQKEPTSSLWRKISVKSVQIKPISQKETLHRTRTLGRRESLMAGEFLAMLNRGRKKRGSEVSLHSPMLSKRGSLTPDCHIISIPEEEEKPKTALWGGLMTRRRSSDMSSGSTSSFVSDEIPKGPHPHFESTLPKPYKSVFGNNSHQKLLDRLSEIENESDTTEASVLPTPTLAVITHAFPEINPEIGKRLMAHNTVDTTNT